MCAASTMVSIGDDGVLNRQASQTLPDVWIDRDWGWLDFNERVLAEALDERTPLLERACSTSRARKAARFRNCFNISRRSVSCIGLQNGQTWIGSF